MTFKRVNEHTIQCVIGVKEIDQMGFGLQELYTNRDKASDFMKSVMAKGQEEGFELNNSMQEIQAVLLPDHQLVLSFTDVNPDDQINMMIENILGAYDTVEAVGKERLEEIFNLTGVEKAKAFQETVVEYQNNAKKEQNLYNSGQTEENKEVMPIHENEKFILHFSTFSDLEKFCKNLSFEVPASVYKDDLKYYMLADVKGLEDYLIDSFVFQAQDFTTDIKNDNLVAAFIVEHGKKMIDQNTIEVLRNL